MAFIRRIFLFVVLNFLVVLSLSFLINLLNLRPYLTGYGLDVNSLLLFCLLWGMGGAFISLSLSRVMAKWMMGVQVIDSKNRDPELQALVHMVHKLARQAALPEMPEVGIYHSPEVNAFATGPSQRRSLVAVSKGLLHKIPLAEQEAILAHEITHIANGDMVTMTLIQGVVNALVMFLARALAYLFSAGGRSREDNSAFSSYFSYSIFVFAFEIIFMLFGSMLVAYFSRRREYRADAGGADLAGKEKMIAALQSLQNLQVIRDARVEQPAFQAMKISASRKSEFFMLFATHPPLEKRIERLQTL